MVPARATLQAEATAVLLVDTDDACRLIVDDQQEGVLTPTHPGKVEVELGEHLVQCFVDDHPDIIWRKIIEVKDSAQVAVTVELKTIHMQNGGQTPNPSAPESPQSQQPPEPQPQASQPPEPSSQPPDSPDSQGSPSEPPQAQAEPYDKALFRKPIPSADLVFLHGFAGVPAGEIIRDKQFRKLLHSVLPDCIFHYGRDMPLDQAIDTVLTNSNLPVEIRDGRYVLVSGHSGPYLLGRGFIWIDMQDGIALGGFYFHPTNGEPTPTVNIFSRQVVKQESLRLSQLPPAFAEDLSEWSRQSAVQPVVTRYFITGSNEKILLEHDEDFCAPTDGTIAPSQDVCEQMNADAADIDVNAAYYLEQTNHATNATAYMIVGQDQIAWIAVRDQTCRVGPDPLRCHVLMTRDRTHLIIHRRPIAHTRL